MARSREPAVSGQKVSCADPFAQPTWMGMQAKPKSSGWSFGAFAGLAFSAMTAIAALSATPGVAVADGKAAAGMSCKASWDCESGNCYDGRCRAKDGGTKGAAGASCKASWDCESSNCYSERCR
ncbi:MAG TPA: hypothetical protein VH165_23365 [Kofleriaceae bacterium]|nr:hypothetical protein [Kofleriaceae bacterium]